MPNYLPYLALLLASVGLFALALRSGRDRKLLALYLTMAGATYLFEFVIMVLLDSYEYRPGIIANAYLDSLAGATISDAFAVPMATVAVVAFRVRVAGLLLVAAVFAAIEYLFVAMGVYRLHWWQIGYTTFFLVFGFILAGLWYGILHRQAHKTFVCLGTAFFAALLLRASAAYLLRVAGLFFFSVGWFALPERGHIAFTTLFIIAEAAVFAPLICTCGSLPLRLAAFAAIFLALLLLAQAGILVAPWWFPGLHIALSAAIFLLNQALMTWLGLATARRR